MGVRFMSSASSCAASIDSNHHPGEDAAPLAPLKAVPLPVDGRGPGGQSVQQIGGQPGSPTIEDLCDQIADDSPSSVPTSASSPLQSVSLTGSTNLSQPTQPRKRQRRSKGTVVPASVAVRDGDKFQQLSNVTTAAMSTEDMLFRLFPGDNNPMRAHFGRAFSPDAISRLYAAAHADARQHFSYITVKTQK